MRTCVLIVLVKIAMVMAIPRKNGINSQLSNDDETNEIERGDENDINFNRIHFHNRRPHHHHHHNHQIEQLENEQFLEDHKVPFPASDIRSNEAKLRFYYSSVGKFIELPLSRATDVFADPWYNASRTTVFFAHGYTGHPNGPAVTSVINAYLARADHNVVLLNWEKLAAGSPHTLASTYINYAMPNAKKLGVYFAITLRKLSDAGLNLNKTHLVGHSLGAHVFGITGNSLLQEGIQLPWITGLDPAAYGFENRPSQPSLTARSAAFVSVVHSDPSKYGYTRALGTVDFWPNYKNGPVTQPGCTNQPAPMFSPKDLCNHNRSWELLVDSLKHPGTIVGSYAKNFRQWKSYSQEERNSNVLAIGEFNLNTPRGSYFLVTNAQSPYGRGKDGI